MAVEGYEPDPVQAPESVAEGGEGRGEADGGGRSAERRCVPLSREQCAQILERALIMEDVIRLRGVRQGRLGSMKDNFQANHHHH